jgi:nickel-dependent lactate racemase
MPNVADRMPLLRSADPSSLVSEDQLREVVRRHANDLDLAGRRLLVLVPDATRSAPLPRLMAALLDAFSEVTALDVLVALGTHPPMAEDELDHLMGLDGDARRKVRVFNHDWHLPDAFISLGTIGAERVRELSSGRISRDVDVRINRKIMDYDHVLVCGPVFPHEVVGFSGGNKYFFPGISGAEMIDVSHWLGALITSYEIIGTLGTTPVRALIDEAASLIPVPRSAVSFVVAGDAHELHGIFAGDVEESWRAAAELSAEVHITYVDRRYDTVLSVVPAMYSDMWVAAKAMYKLEPVVEDGGELIIYAPHVREFSPVHGEDIRRVGYRTRDYIVAHWEDLDGVPWGVLAHSTHLRGSGEYDAITDTDLPRIRVTLATGISKAECEAVGLGYLDPGLVEPSAYANREREGTLLVPRAGETLFRLRRSNDGEKPDYPMDDPHQMRTA